MVVLNRRQFRRRVLFIVLGFVSLCVLITVRLMQLQILDNRQLASLATRQFTTEYAPSPYRLPIYDRNGQELALSIISSSVFARPKLITDRARTAKQLASILGGPEKTWLRRLSSRKSFIWLRRQIPSETAKKLTELKLRGVFVEPENKRLYPNRSLGSHLIGFTDIDGNGLAGLELSLDRELLQQEERFALPRDGRGTPSYLDRRYAEQHSDRRGVFTTIDRRLQYALEVELDKSMERTDAAASLAVILDPSTGEILALGQRPAFDPNEITGADTDAIANRLISHLYEPGSVLKTIFAAEAIEQKIFDERSPIDCGAGKLEVGTTLIGEADTKHKFGVLPLEDVLKFSSNIGAVKIGQALGVSGVRDALSRFGLTSKTGIKLPGEATMVQRPLSFWTPLHLATASFGQGISVTPLQAVLAFAPFANGGYLVRPRILMNEASAEPDAQNSLAEQIISSKTALKMRDMLTRVTQTPGGTGIGAKIEGVKIAGKTGTAQKYVSGKGYRSNKYFSSFIGFLPADNPALLIGVMVDEPAKNYYASSVAVPLFRSIATAAMQILDLYPKQIIRSPVGPTIVSHQGPSERYRPIQLVHHNAWSMPDLTGVSVRDALRLVGRLTTKLECRGSGYVKTQSPAVGTRMTKTSKVKLDFASTDQLAGKPG